MPGKISRENGKKGGRPKGKKNAATLEKEKVLGELRQRIMKSAQRILDGQMSLAAGQQFLYRIDTDKKGKRSKPVLVVSPEEIANYLDGEYGNGESIDTKEKYYYMTTIEPNNMAIDSMFNRAFGKPVESMEVSGPGGKPIEAKVVMLPPKSITLDTNENKRIKKAKK